MYELYTFMHAVGSTAHFTHVQCVMVHILHTSGSKHVQCSSALRCMYACSSNGLAAGATIHGICTMFVLSLTALHYQSQH
jgi:hypothetical protein